MIRQSFLVRAVLLAGDEQIQWAGDVMDLPCTGEESTALLAARIAVAVLEVEHADDFAEFTYTRIR